MLFTFNQRLDSGFRSSGYDAVGGDHSDSTLFEDNSAQDYGEQQIPCGNVRQRGGSKDRSRSFASLRMTALLVGVA